MTREKKLGSGLYFSAEELFPALLLVSCAFLKTLAVTATDAGASVLFLTESAGQNIPQILIAIAALILIVWPILSALKEKSPLIPVFLLCAAAGISFLLYGASFFIQEPILAPIGMVWKEGFRITAEVAFWLTAFRFGIFNDKIRLLLAVLIAQAVGMLATSGLILLMAEHPEALILYAVVLSLGAAALLKMLIDNGSAPIQLRFVLDKQKIKKTGNDSLQKNLSLSFFISSGILFFAAGIFQYYFLISAAEFSMGQADILSRIYSSVFAGTAIATTAAFYVFFKSRLTLFAGLFLLPVVLLAAAIGGWFALFGILIAAQIVFGLANSAKEAVLQTIPLAVSLRTGFKQTLFRKSVIEPIALAFSGIFLLIIEQSATEFEFLYFMIGLSVVVLMLIFAVRRAYSAQILNMLKKHLWRGGKLLLTGKGINKHLQDCLNSREAEDVLYALRIIEESITPRFLYYLMNALNHDNEDVRLYALSKIEDLKLSSAVPEVMKLLEKDDSTAVRQNAVRVICRLGGAEEREKAVALVQDPLLREGALTGLLAVGREGVFVAIKCVADLSASPDRGNRLLAANVLGNAGNPAFYHPLLSLLADPDMEVCKAALKAAGKLINPMLLPAITETFRYSELREEACAALLQYRETAFGEIDRILDSQRYPVQFRILLARLVARISSPEAEKFLFDHIQIKDRRVRFKIIKALALSGYKASGKAVNIVRLCLYDEMETATGILAALHSFNKNNDEELAPSLDLLKSALNREIEYIKERVLLLLALLFPSKELVEFLNAYSPIVPENEKALKMTDKLLSGELRTLCLPLFEDKTLQQKLAQLRPQFYPPVLSINGHIQDILETPVGETADWTRACAAYAAGHAKDIAFVNALTAMLSDADAIVRETAVWALGKILPREEAARLIAGNLEDSSVYVARMARFVTDGSGQIVF